MSLDAIKKVTETEQISAQRKAEAEADSKKLIGEAERSGHNLVAESKKAAEKKVRSMLADAEKGAAVEAKAVQQQTEQSCEQLKAEARTKLEDAAALIVGRVVNV